MSLPMPSKTHIRPCLHAGAPSPRTVASFAVALVVALALLASDALAAAQPPVGLGTADSFAVLAGQTVTNIGPSAINGDLGVAPGTAVAGLLPVVGTIHTADAVAAQAQSDLTTAYDDAAGRNAPFAAPADLGGLTLTAGLYSSASSLGLTGAVTLDAEGDPDAVFVFQAGSTLITAAASHVNLINGAQPCNVFWQVGSSATLGTTSVFAGTVMALTSISMNNGVTVQGRALARNGSVTLINDTINAPRCAPGTTGGGGTSSSPARIGGIGGGATIPAVAPVLGQIVNLDLRAGTVKVKGPGAPGYVALSKSASVAVGSLIDMRHGTVTLHSALPGGAVQRAVFHGGLSEVRQARGTGGLTELVLRGPLPTCTGTAARAAMTNSPPPRRRLWGHDTHGKFRTRGGQSVATVRGTDWYVEDRCDGTLTRVTTGSVSVYDSGRHRSVIVRAGHSYLARIKR
jgi:Ice-binding-like